MADTLELEQAKDMSGLKYLFLYRNLDIRPFNFIPRPKLWLLRPKPSPESLNTLMRQPKYILDLILFYTCFYHYLLHQIVHVPRKTKRDEVL